MPHVKAKTLEPKNLARSALQRLHRENDPGVQENRGHLRSAAMAADEVSAMAQ